LERACVNQSLTLASLCCIPYLETVCVNPLYSPLLDQKITNCIFFIAFPGIHVCLLILYMCGFHLRVVLVRKIGDAFMA
jgi:hypothetical protein